MTTPRTHAPPSRWMVANAWMGYIVFGFPAALAIPALMTTLGRFGLWDTLVSAVPAAAWACLPLLIWIRYLRRRPRTKIGTLTWGLVGLAAVSTLVVSPLFFWAVPALAVLISEALRLVLAPGISRAAATVRARRTKPCNLPAPGSR